jgi:ankyrin repeat protein
MDLYLAVDNCNRIKVDFYNYADADQWDNALVNAIETVRILLEAGADPNTKITGDAVIWRYGFSLWFMYGGITPLMLSRVAKVSQLLIDYGARVNDRDEHGRTALMIAVFFDHYYDDNNIITEMLIKNRADINAQNNAGLTALYYAINHANIEAIKLLVENGANVNIRDNRGWSPFVAAKVYNYYAYVGYSEKQEEMFNILSDAGAVLSDADLQLIDSVNERNRRSEKDEGLNMEYADR